MKTKNHRVKGPDYYDKIYKGSPRYKIDPWGVQPIYNKMLKFCKGPILEIGCGTGQFAAYLHKKKKVFNNRYVLGIDFSKVGIEKAKERSPGLRFIHGDVFDNKWIFKRKFNTVFMCEVLEHIENDIELIEMIPRKKTIVFSVPNYDSQGHVRYFESLEDVKRRYRNHIKFTDEDMNGNGKSRTVFILGGVRG